VSTRVTVSSSEEGREILLAYVGRSDCVWSQDPSLPGLLRQVHGMIQDRARALNIRYRAVGIALDREPESGLRHLRQVGPMFTEVASGGQWLSLFATPFFWQDFPGEPATPQLIIIAREVSRHGGEGETITFGVEGQRVILRVVGLQEIREWTRAGAPVPMAILKTVNGH